MTKAKRAELLAIACEWESREPRARAFKAESKPWGLSVELRDFGGRAMTGYTFWESAPDEKVDVDGFRSALLGSSAATTPA